MQNLKKKKKGGKKTLRESFPSKGSNLSRKRDRQHNKHYTTPIDDSIGEIKYLDR